MNEIEIKLTGDELARLAIGDALVHHCADDITDVVEVHITADRTPTTRAVLREIVTDLKSIDNRLARIEAVVIPKVEPDRVIGKGEPREAKAIWKTCKECQAVLMGAEKAHGTCDRCFKNEENKPQI